MQTVQDGLAASRNLTDFNFTAQDDKDTVLKISLLQNNLVRLRSLCWPNGAIRAI